MDLAQNFIDAVEEGMPEMVKDLKPLWGDMEAVIKSAMLAGASLYIKTKYPEEAECSSKTS